MATGRAFLPSRVSAQPEVDLKAVRNDPISPEMLGFASSARHVGMRVEREVLRIAINRPAVRDALHPEAHSEVAPMIDAVAADSTLCIA